MWHRLQILVTEVQRKWLKDKAYSEDKSQGEVVRELLDQAMSPKKKNELSESFTLLDTQDYKSSK